MYSFKPITSVRVVIYDHTGGKLLPHIRQQLSNYKQRWNQSIADKVFIVYQPEDIPANCPVIMASYIQLNLGLTETILLPSLNQLTHYHLRQLMLDIEYDCTDKLSIAMEWLDSLPDLIACDFETAPKLTKEDKAKLQLSPDLTHDQNLQLLATGLSHPSLVTVTHLSVASSESNSFVIILTDENRQPILDWLVDTDRKQIWHNAMFDLMHVFYHTNKFPKNVEDSQLMWATILNHTDSLQRKVGLKHLASTIYKEWAVSHDLFGLEHQYSTELIKYAAIDSQATMYLYNEALAHPDFQLSMAPIDITEVFPIPEPKEFNPGRRYFYESVVKQLLYVMIRIRLNGLPLDLTKVDTLRNKLDTVLSDATIALNTNPLVEEFISKESSNAKITFIKSTREKLKEYTEFLKPLDYSEVQGRSFLMNYLKEIYQFNYETNEFLPNGKDKWSINHVKQLSKQITEEPLYSILELILTKQLDPNESICKEAALRLAIAKSQFLKANQSLVEKIEEADTLSRIQFNPNSVPQKQALFQYLNIEPVAFSKDTKAPSWSREALEEIQPTLTGDRYNLVTELLNISEVKTTRTNFVENFTTYNINSRVYPNFKLWGTLSLTLNKFMLSLYILLTGVAYAAKSINKTRNRFQLS